jgi:hypothetical protein
VQRRGIEVNFREEKTRWGDGEGPVRHGDFVGAVPALPVVSCSILLPAAFGRLDRAAKPGLRPPFKRAAETAHPRFSTPEPKPEKLAPDLRSAVLCAAKREW